MGGDGIHIAAGQHRILHAAVFGAEHLDGLRDARVGAGWRGYVGQPFRIIARVRPAEPCPMWVIEFANGFRMAAYAEEIFEEA